MTFDEKVDEAERLFSLCKKLSFINPKFGLYGTGVSFALLAIGFYDLSLLIVYTSICISLIGIALLYISKPMWIKGMNLMSESIPDFEKAENSTELDRMLSKHMNVLAKS